MDLKQTLFFPEANLEAGSFRIQFINDPIKELLSGPLELILARFEVPISVTDSLVKNQLIILSFLPINNIITEKTSEGISFTGIKTHFNFNQELEIKSITKNLLSLENSLLEQLEIQKKQLSNEFEAEKAEIFEKQKQTLENELSLLTESLKEKTEETLTNTKTEFEDKLSEFCNFQNNFMQKSVRESVEKLKQIKKIVSLYSVQPSVLEKIKNNLISSEEHSPDDIEVSLLNARDHFRNIHEVYLDVLINQQTQMEKQVTEQSQFCISVKKYTPDLKMPDCVFFQKLCYCRDLLLKFVTLDKNARFHKEVLSAFVDVFDLQKNQSILFFANLKLIK